MIYDIIIFWVLFGVAVWIITSCAIGSKRDESNKKLEDKMNNLK